MNGDELDLQKTPADYSFDPSKQACSQDRFMQSQATRGIHVHSSVQSLG